MKPILQVGELSPRDFILHGQDHIVGRDHRDYPEFLIEACPPQSCYSDDICGANISW